MKIKYNVTGMSCANCKMAVEKAASKVSGVKKAEVNLFTNELYIDTDDSFNDEKNNELLDNVKKAGYGIEKENNNKKEKDEFIDPFKKEKRNLLFRLVSSLILLAILMYFSMGYMFSIPFRFVPIYRDIRILSLIECVLAFIIICINYKYFVSGVKAVINLTPNMDTLVAMGSAVSFIYSFVMMRRILGTNIFTLEGYQSVQRMLFNLYFESSAMIVTFVDIGKLLETIAKGKTTDSLRGLYKLKPTTATLKIDNEEKIIPIEEVKINDLLIIKDGDKVPTDGVIIEGNLSLDESMFTGESIPVEKTIDNEVYGGSIAVSGYAVIKVINVGNETKLNKIIELVKSIGSNKAPIAKLADKVASVFVPAVIVIALITLDVWYILGYDFSFALGRFISVLVISCPCALGLATPTAIMVGSGIGAKNGILFKNAEALEMTGKTDVACFDKTGTITEGKMKVVHIEYKDNVEDKKEKIIDYLYNIENKTKHPIAKAIVSFATDNGAKEINVNDYKTLNAFGVEATINGDKVKCGKKEMFKDFSDKTLIDKESKNPYTESFISINDEVVARIDIEDSIKDDSKFAIEELKKINVEPCMITGDNEQVARFVSDKVGIDTVVAGVLPDGKVEVINNMKEKNQFVMMVGDGINDAPSLVASDIGVAMGEGQDIAMDSSSVVIMNNDLLSVVNAIRLSRATIKNIKENLFFAFIYNIVLIPVAAGVLINAFNIYLSPMICSACMCLSSVSVVTNALRLNFFKPISKGNNYMEIIVKIDGMMCNHCEMHVMEAFKKLPEVVDAKASHEKKECVLTLKSDLSDDIIKKTVEDAGYKYIA